MTDSLAELSVEDERRLDGTTDVLLAPVRGSDLRRDLPAELFERRPAAFTAKFAFAVALITAAWVVLVAVPHWWAAVPAVLLAGLMYAHLVELQHECLHEHAYSRRAFNRLVGFVCGVPMLSSFSHYKYDHLRHHAFLGTPRNHEFFNYRFSNLDRPSGFLRGAFHLGRYPSVLANIGRSLLGRPVPGVSRSMGRKMRTEYAVMGAVLVSAVAASIALHTWLFVVGWLVPALAVAEPTHFLIELPEHFGLNTQSDADVLTNTRTITAGRLAGWFTNGNDLHTAHHFHQGVPMARVPQLHDLITGQIGTIDRTYVSFYRKVLSGELQYQDLAQTCMTR